MKILALLYLILLSSFSQPKTGDLKLIINELEKNTGVVRVLIFSQADGFPDDPKKAFKAFSIPVKNSSAQTTLSDIPVGSYAISVFHDEDQDGVFRKNSVGLPIDTYGFSNNPKLLFGPPSFSKCKVAVTTSPVVVEIILK